MHRRIEIRPRFLRYYLLKDLTLLGKVTVATYSNSIFPLSSEDFRSNLKSFGPDAALYKGPQAKLHTQHY